MNGPSPAEIRIIYSASSSRLRPGAPARRPTSTAVAAAPRARAGSAAVRAPAASRRALPLGLLNLAVAGLFFYLAWWPINSAAFVPAVMNTPILVSPEQSEAFRQRFLRRTARTAPARDAEGAVAPQPAPSAPKKQLRGQTRQVLIWGSFYGWLALVSASCCCLALAGGSALGIRWRLDADRVGTMLLIGTIAVLLLGGGAVWLHYGRGFPEWMLRGAVGLLMLAAAGAGMHWSRRALGLTRLAAVSVVVAALGSATAVYLARISGIAPDEYVHARLISGVASFAAPLGASGAAILLLVTIFLAHGLYGLFLLGGGPRLLTPARDRPAAARRAQGGPRSR